MKLIIGVTVAVVVLLVGVLAALSMLGPKASGSGTGSMVTIESVERGNLLEVVNAPGQIEPRRKVGISARVSARIDELPFEPGDTVKAGDVLVRLDASELKASLQSRLSRREAQAAQIEVDGLNIGSHEATLQALTVSLADAQRNLKRQRQLLESGDISVSAVDDAQMKSDELKARHESQQAALQAAQHALLVARHNLSAADAEIAQARENLEYTVMRSPIDGVVIRVNAEVGELAITGTMNNPGTVIMEVADLSRMLMVAYVDESDVARVHKEQNATIHLSAFEDREFHGIVNSVALASSTARSGSNIFETRVLLDNTDTAIPTGLTADADIVVTEHADVLKVPSQAVLGSKTDELPEDIRRDNPNIDRDKTMTTVVYRFIDGKAVVTPVRIGPSDVTHTLIESGLNEGDRIITGPYKELEKLTHDQAVRDKAAEELKEDKNEQAATTQPTDAAADANADSAEGKPAAVDESESKSNAP